MAIDMFLKIGSIKGESLDKAFPGWIDVRSFSFGEHNTGSTQVGGGAGIGRPTFEDLRFTTAHGRHATELIKSATLGTHFPSADLRVRLAGLKPVEVLKIELHEVMVTSYDLGAVDGSDMPSEAVSLTYAKITFTTKLASGATGEQTFSYDIVANTQG